MWRVFIRADGKLIPEMIRSRKNGIISINKEISDRLENDIDYLVELANGSVYVHYDKSFAIRMSIIKYIDEILKDLPNPTIIEVQNDYYDDSGSYARSIINCPNVPLMFVELRNIE